MEEQENEFYDDDEVSELSSSPSIPEGEIDFNFVYAMHTFLATVEGQATSQKGDTLVLLDDSNSYWWLVRNVKDQSIGYLPAEHIETPAERLARLNKHRNVELATSQTNDVPTSPRPSKFKMLTNRRTGARSVSFSSPKIIQYVAYESEDDYEGEDVLHMTGETQEVGEPLTLGHHRIQSVEINDASVDGAMQTNRTTNAETAELEETGGVKRYSLTPIGNNEPSNHTRSGSATSTDSRTPASDRKNQSHDGARVSVHSETSVASNGDENDTKEKKKKGVFGGLFKKKSKREKATDVATTSNGGVEAKAAPGIQHEKSSQSLHESRIPDPERPSQLLALPTAVNEMRSSVLMQVDPVVAEMIDEPTHRGAVDEVEMLQSHKLRTPDLHQSEPQKPESDTFAWHDTNIATYLKSDETRLKNMVLLVSHQAEMDKARYQVDYMLKDLDSLLIQGSRSDA